MDETDLPPLRHRDREVLARIVDAYVQMREQPFLFVEHMSGAFLQPHDEMNLSVRVPSVELDVPAGKLALERLTDAGLIEWASSGQWCEPAMCAVRALGPGRPIVADSSGLPSQLRDQTQRWEMLRDQGEVSDFSDDLMDVLDDICEQLRRIADALEATPPSYLEWVKESRHVSREATKLSGAIDAIQKLGAVAKLASWLNTSHDILGKISEAVDRLGPPG